MYTYNWLQVRRRGSYHVAPERKATSARYAIGKRDILLSFLQYWNV